jgi:hypothetical protein
MIMKGGNNMKRIFAVSVAVLLIFSASYVMAYTIGVPTVGGGWYWDEVGTSLAPSIYSPYSLSLTSPTIFSITDAYVPGDTWYVSDFGTPILTTSFTLYPAFPPSDVYVDAAWANTDYTHGQIILAAGSHSLSITTDGVGGLPAHTFTRLDAVPEPTTMLLLGSGLIGLAGYGRKKFFKK